MANGLVKVTIWETKWSDESPHEECTADPSTHEFNPHRRFAMANVNRSRSAILELGPVCEHHHHVQRSQREGGVEHRPVVHHAVPFVISCLAAFDVFVVVIIGKESFVLRISRHAKLSDLRITGGSHTGVADGDESEEGAGNHGGG